jgi:NTE family protein
VVADDAGPVGPIRADLVLEAGGVRGLGLVGAVAALAAAGYTFPRVAGTSAGALTGAVVAALQRAGEPVDRIEEISRSLDTARIRDRGRIGRALGPLGIFADVVSLAVDRALYESAYLRSWFGGVLADLGVHTFGDLRLTGEHVGTLEPHQRYALVVTASDVSRRRLVRLPWDYPEYGRDPDDQRVLDAVLASAAIPFFFEPVLLRVPGRPPATLVDGGLISAYPIALFDRTDGAPPRWPTFGVRLSPREPTRVPTRAVRGLVGLAVATAETALIGADARAFSDPCVVSRSIFVDTTGVSPIDFALSRAAADALVADGRSAARAFLSRWDESAYLRRCREVAA